MKKVVLAFAFLASFASCSREQPFGRAHNVASPAPAAQALEGDPHSVQRDVTVSAYCLACHPQYATGGHPLGISQTEAGTLFPEQFFASPIDPAVVIVNGSTVECSSCHDDGSAGFPYRTVSNEVCTACHNKDATPQDTTAPSASIVAIPSPTRGSISVSAAATDDVGVVRYQLFVGSGPYGADTLVSSIVTSAGAVTFPFDTTTLPDGQASFEVRAYDAAYNRGIATTSVMIDNTNPTVAIGSPAPGALVRGPIAVAASASSVALAELWAGASPGTLVSSVVPAGSSFAFPFDTTTQPDGIVGLVVRVYDAAGNVGSAETSVQIDNTPPSVAITSPASGSVLKGATTIASAASDAVGVAKVDFYVDGMLLATSGAPPYSVVWQPVRHSGTHTLASVATDLVGNVATSAAVTVVVR